MASPVVESVGDGAVAGTATSVTITAPTGITDDDLLVAVIGRGASSNDNLNLTGWTQYYFAAHDGGATDVLWKKASSESGDYTFSWGGNSPAYGGILRISGWDGTTPFIGTTPTASTGSDTTPDPPASATVTSDDYLAIALVHQEGKQTGARFTASPTGYTERIDRGVSAGGSPANSGGVGVFTKAFTGTTDNPGTCTSDINDDWLAQTLLVAPAAGGAVTATPAVVAATVTVPAPTNVTAAALVTPAVNAATVDVKAVTTTIGFDVSPATVAGTFTVPPVTVDIAATPSTTFQMNERAIYADGTEAGAVAYGASYEAATNVPVDTPFLYRQVIKNNTAGALDVLPAVQYRYMPKGTGGTRDWVPVETAAAEADLMDPVTASSTRIHWATGTESHGTATTQRLGSGTFAGGTIVAGSDQPSSALTIPAGQEAEFVFTLEMDSTDIAADQQENFQFRLVDSAAGAVYDTYTHGTASDGWMFASVNPPWTWENDLQGGTNGNAITTSESSPDNFDAINDTSATLTYDNTSPHGGWSLSGQQIKAAADGLGRMRWWDINQGGETWIRWYHYPISDDGTADIFLYITGGYEDGDVLGARVDLNGDGTVALRDNAALLGTTTTAMTDDDKWWRFELRYKPESWEAAGDGELELRMYDGDSTTPTETLGPFTSETTQTEWEDLDFGLRQGVAERSYRFAGIKLSNTGWIGPDTSNVTVTPAVVAATATFPLPTVTAAATVEPAVVAATVNVLAVTTDIASDPITVTPTVVAATVNVLAPTVQAAATVEPATVAATVNVLAPTVLAAATVTPATVASTVDVLAVTVTAASVVTPAVVAATVDVLAPTATAGALVTPAVVAATVDVLAVTVDVAGGPVTVTPAVVSTTATIEPVTVTAGSAVTPAVVAASVNVLAPTVTAAALVTPATIAMTTDTPTPAVNVEGGPVTTVPAVVATSITVEPVTASHPATTTPAVVAASVTVEPVTIAIPYTVTPAVVGTAATVLSPVVTAAALVTPAVVAGTVDVLAVTVDVAGSDTTVTPAVVGTTVDVKAVTVDAPSIVAPVVVSGAFDTKAVTVTAGATVTPSVVAGTFTVLPVTTLIGGDTVVTPRVVNRQFRFWYSLPSHPALVTPAAVAVTADVPAVTVGAETTVTPATVAMTVTVLPVTQAIGTTKVFPATVTASVIVYPATHSWPPNINDNAGDTTDENVGGRTRRASVAGSSTGASSKGTTRGTTGIQGTTEYNP